MRIHSWPSSLPSIGLVLELGLGCRALARAMASVRFRVRVRQGWRRELSDGGLTLPTRGLKYGFLGTVNAKNIRKNRVSHTDWG